ncbi:MAG: HWE histidine kinase domain-containing protein [Burkholderiales bacterium]
MALAAGQMGSWDWDVVTGEVVWDAGQHRIFGVEPADVRLTMENIRSFVHPEDLARIQSIVENGATDANTFQLEVRILRPDGQTRWCICAAAMMSDVLGKITRVSGVTIDITELKEAEARRTLLVREVDHRARNALAIVQSIVRMTKAKSIDAYVSMVEGRIRALSTAHTLLAESRWEGANLGQLVDEELAPYRSGEAERIVISGPPVFLKPETAQTIALVLHELATNAAKYGALSELKGQVLLNWQWNREALELQWRESGGPRVKPPTTKGYGTKVIAASVTQQLDGTATFDWKPNGLRFAMSIAIDTPKERAARPRKAKKARGNGGKPPSEGRHVLLVEDEAIVGMMMKDILTEIGFHVVGPFGNVADAIGAIDMERLQAAVLDINLRGETIYTLADELTGRGVPIVFVTGYGAEAIDGRFANVPVLQKPVDNAALRRALNGDSQSAATRRQA